MDNDKLKSLMLVVAIRKFIEKYLKPENDDQTNVYIEEFLRLMVEASEEILPGVKDHLKITATEKTKEILFREKN